MSGISTHVLDTTQGRPAQGVPVALEYQASPDAWELLARAATDAGGRVPTLLPAGRTLAAGTYRLVFDTRAYFAAQAQEAFYPEVRIVFIVRDAAQHYHIPLLLSPYGYTTYRGS